MNFIYFYPLIGGMLLGLSAVLLLLFNGRIAGISGISSGLLTQAKEIWRWLFLLGMITTGYISTYLIQQPIHLNQSWLILGCAGFLVGLGAKLGNGCTSGHGICGVGRLSKRSIVAVCIFILTAMVTVYIRTHLF